MNKDLCIPCDDGILNIRTGAIITKDGKLLMVGNDRDDYLYSVGGRIKFGETAEEAIVREVFEETGVNKLYSIDLLEVNSDPKSDKRQNITLRYECLLIGDIVVIAFVLSYLASIKAKSL